MAKIESFEDMDIWKEAVKIAVKIYKITSKGKLEKDFRAKDQLRAAAISISNNIAEGFEYNSNKAFLRFLLYVKGSAGELRSELFVLKEAEMIDEDIFQELHDNIKQLSKNIQGFRKYLKDFASIRNSNFVIF
jgi:four helix bundle protein